ncbi:peptidase [Actinoplanes sp. SE50]|uniref:C40 family peptidase n=1 Tax=unclassified Actinoplanes TaxID=2626549 RepID=UPI00023ECC40|nr:MULTISPECIES: NlpC/P60 family protein [unclassified Actinoplanes]AEV82649.1 Endopeptidase ykfC [Actinoplanes sp. SE50/110]ATO81045.1 peptidase [Actinoplanes sp. SE50]SLL98452.1 peptidase [Actinoplanes sp. SE50/110]
MSGAGTAALSLGLCLCAGQLIGASPAVAAEATPVTTAANTVRAVAPAAAKTLVQPRLTTTTTARRITAGSVLKVTAKVINPKTGKIAKGTIRLQGYRGGKWQTWATKSSTGAVTFTTGPKSSIYIRTLFTGTGYAQTSSSRMLITVRANGGARVLAEAKKHVGALYKFAAAGPKRFDCSGFTLYVYKVAAGRSLPHKADAQQRYGSAVSKSQAQPGDLIIFRSGSYGYHAGIYAGGGYMYDSPHTGARVGKHKMYGSNYVVRRIA